MAIEPPETNLHEIRFIRRAFHGRATVTWGFIPARGTTGRDRGSSFPASSARGAFPASAPLPRGAATDQISIQ